MNKKALPHSLHYNTDKGPGIERVRKGKNFFYRNSQGKILKNATLLKRIQSLAIPPAYEKVWISPDPHAHLQATGRDSRGRKQYRYHPAWREHRDGLKYDHVIAFGRALPRIRKAVKKDLGQPALSKKQVVAAVVELLEKTLIRIGNEEYARSNHSFGLTTLQNRHVKIHGAQIEFSFRGKSGVEHDLKIEDPRLARIIHRCQELPGHELFEYRDRNSGQVTQVTSADVNLYLHEVAGTEFTAKDFRTWAGTLLAAEAFRELELDPKHKANQRNIVRAVEKVAKRLGNTKAVCRKCYVHPAIFETYLDGSLAQYLSLKADRTLQSSTKLKPTEAAVLALLSARLKQSKPFRQKSRD